MQTHNSNISRVVATHWAIFAAAARALRRGDLWRARQFVRWFLHEARQTVTRGGKR